MRKSLFDLEKVAKKFCERFKREHDAFLGVIQGILSHGDREWYTSVMLNRLMFTYFMQGKGFLGHHQTGKLDGDHRYLQNHLKTVQEQSEQDHFHSFYQSFLLRLFHEGFCQREHPPELKQLLGNIPYLNRSLFDVHTLEQNYPEIEIPDQAFARLFAFFDAYQWILNNRPPRNDQEINPDVLGYIFEKYSNQKQMGAYYTREDITGYISKNTILPYILEAAKERCEVVFKADGPAWSLLREAPDRYIYQALKHGCCLPLPAEIEIGTYDISQRAAWNKPAPTGDGSYALPTETWREVVARRQRYEAVKARLEAGEIISVNDLITYNLDIFQFVQDVIAYSEEPDELYAFYTTVEHITILDPTCGSGAFLFAALDILESLYKLCLDRMHAFVDERAHLTATLPSVLARNYPWITEFRRILQDVAKHPGREYFIYKSVIVCNLYGVDIMEEAVEICKQRLFLKLVAQVEKLADLEPLLTINFHIRSGNTLIGMATYEEMVRAISVKAMDKGEWEEGHQQFHWFVEFHGIMKSGGFDVIIGNPPYVVYSKVKSLYQIQGYTTQSCGNLYAYTLERALALLVQGGWCGVIIPISAISGESYQPLSEQIFQRQVWTSSYSNRPGKLFAGVEQRLTILLLRNVLIRSLQISAYRHWYEAERTFVFTTLSYATSSLWAQTGMPIKSGGALAERVFASLVKQQGFPLLHSQQGKSAIWVHNGPTYWVRALAFEPNTEKKDRRSSHYVKIPVSTQADAYILAAILSSSTFYFFYKMISNCRDLGQKELALFPLGMPEHETRLSLTHLGQLLAECLCNTAAPGSRKYPSGVIEYEEYYPARAKLILDEIDRVLARHYGFTDEELDFIINYDIKYRMGRSAFHALN
jgi:hypothetical protein